MRRLTIAVTLFAVPLFAAGIKPAAIKAHIQFLASDTLEGREAGTRGHEIAAGYVATQFEAFDIEPSGDGGTYLQRIRFRTAMLDAGHSSLCIRVAGGPCEPLVHRKDVLLATGAASESTVDAAIVHAGFGISAPELGHDDYANIDVRGKIVAVLNGAPPRFPHSQRAFYSDSFRKAQLAAARGAVGLLTIRTNESERRFPWARMSGQEDGTSFRALDASGQPIEIEPRIRGAAMLGPAAAEQLFRHSTPSLATILADADKSNAHSFALDASASFHIRSVIGEQTSPNVVGIIRGSDDALAHEFVALTAHLDHLGLTARGEDRVRNGALDNASGIAALIEIARMVAALPIKPARSIAFVAVTAEEKGEQGSLAFARHPSLPGPVVANVNMDMLTMLFPMKSLVALGMQHSTLGTLAAAAAREAGFELEEDPLPEEVRFIRSDQYSFVKQGIPAITYKGGFRSLDPAVDGEKLTRDWMRNIYHSPKDGPDQKIDYASGARWALANFNLVVAIASERDRPRWNEGDFFGTRFAK